MHEQAREGEIDSIVAATVACFQRITKRHLLFHLIFISVVLLASVLFILFYSLLASSFLLSVTIACFFFVCVMYFVLRLYFQEQKPRQFIALRDEYLAACNQKQQYQSPIEAHIATAKASEKAFVSLTNKEPSFCRLFSKIGIFKAAFSRLSKALQWHDVHKMKEFLLLSCIDAYTNVIKNQPTSYDAHAALACAYINLATHYNAALSNTKSAALTREFKQKFRQSSKQAIEELTILKEYTPNDLWAHTQLASSYRELNLPEKEIEEYETCVRLCPTDMQMLFTLGTLYFKQGHNAKGLRVYEKLKTTNQQHAEVLISHYGGEQQG